MAERKLFMGHGEGLYKKGVKSIRHLGENLREGGKRVLRQQEEHFLPRRAAERQAYEQQKLALQDPLSEAYRQEISIVRSMVTSLMPDEVKPKRELFERIAPTDPRLFKKVSQAIDSDHNIPHIMNAASLSIMDATRRALKQTPGEKISPERLEEVQERAGVVGELHDVRRGGDIVASLIPLVLLHGWSADLKKEPLMEYLGVSEQIRRDTQAVKNIGQALRHHDIDLLDWEFWKKGQKYRSAELHTIKIADRATIGRLFESKHWIVRLLASYLAEKRMRDYPKDAKEAVDQEYMNTLIRIAGAMDILTRQKVKQQEGKPTLESVYKATLNTLGDLGFFAKAQEGETDPHMVTRRRTLPAAA